MIRHGAKHDCIRTRVKVFQPVPRHREIKEYQYLGKVRSRRSLTPLPVRARERGLLKFSATEYLARYIIQKVEE